MLPDYFEFQNSSKILSGKNALENIAFELKNLGATRPCLLANSQLQTFLDIVSPTLKPHGIAICCVYENIPAESSTIVVSDIAKAYRENNCDSIVAVGGGSVIESAKGLAICISHDCDDLRKLVGNEIISRKNHIPFVAVPTTVGTGSDVSLAAVIEDPDKNVKLEFLSYNLLPDVAVLDPRLSATMPTKLIASTGMDALTHAIEAFTSLQKNPLSDAYALSAVELIRDNLLAAVQNPSNESARFAIANAALLAGASFSNSMVGIVHAIAHACCSLCHMSHSDAVSVLLPHCMNYNLDACNALYGKLLPWICGEVVYTSTPPSERGTRVIIEIYNITERLSELAGLPLTLTECGMTEDKLPQIARTAINDVAILMNKKSPSLKDILEILQKAL